MDEVLVQAAVDLSGRTSLGALAALMANAAIVIGNDTGISHLADALAVPSVVVFSASDPVRWGPLDSALHRVIDVRSPLEQLQPTGGAPLGDVMAEVEYLLAMGGSGVS
jgi:ADP-heptose:LPS heptosyltransferase